MVRVGTCWVHVKPTWGRGAIDGESQRTFRLSAEWKPTSCAHESELLTAAPFKQVEFIIKSLHFPVLLDMSDALLGHAAKKKRKKTHDKTFGLHDQRDEIV